MNSKEGEKDKRMRELVSKMSQKEIVIKESVVKKVDKKALSDQNKRFKELSSYDESFGYSSASSMVGGMGKTVNSISDSPLSNNGLSSAMSKPAVNAGVTPREALALSIKRTCESGDPINNIGFYDEINWSLENMGHPAKSPIDIKNAINDMLKYGEIKSS